MTSPDLVALPKWPDIPACYGWLSLDRRGNWRLKGELVRHGGLAAFINRNYRADEKGNWVFHNGPQKVYVALDYTPLVLRREGEDRYVAHTGIAADPVSAAYLDEEGNVLLRTAPGLGLLDDRDLVSFVADCRNACGEPADEAAMLAAMGGGTEVFWHGLAVQPIRRGEVPQRFGFRPDPAP